MTKTGKQEIRDDEILGTMAFKHRFLVKFNRFTGLTLPNKTLVSSHCFCYQIPNFLSLNKIFFFRKKMEYQRGEEKKMITIHLFHMDRRRFAQMRHFEKKKKKKKKKEII